MHGSDPHASRRLRHHASTQEESIVLSASDNPYSTLNSVACPAGRDTKEPNSETNVRVLGCMSTYKEFYEVGAQLPSQVHSQVLEPVQIDSQIESSR